MKRSDVSESGAKGNFISVTDLKNRRFHFERLY